MKKVQLNPLMFIALLASAAVVVGQTFFSVVNYDENAVEKTSVCSDKILIPQTIEQADYLEKHAGEAYAKIALADRA